jgi:hypothetical protein
VILYFQVEKVSNLKYRAFGPDPTDPNNMNVDSGKYVEEITLNLIPDPLWGGRGTLEFRVNNPQQIGQFQPGAKVTVEVKVEG